MTASNLDGLRYTQTSPGGAIYRSNLATAIAAIVVAATPLESGTASTYEVPSFVERTAAGPVGQFMPVPPESTGEAVLEIRRRSGLTWEELGDLFNVTRRSVHHWASGKPVSAMHERMIRRVLAAIRRLDQGSISTGSVHRRRLCFWTRVQLLAVDDTLGASALKLLKEGRFDEAIARVEGVQAPEYRHIPLSRMAQNTRRPPTPALLLEADQDRPDVPAKAHTVRAARTPKNMS